MMYVKIIRQTEDERGRSVRNAKGHDCKPRLHEMFSATRLAYRKYAGDSLEEILQGYGLVGEVLAGEDEDAVEVIYISVLDIDGLVVKRLIAPMARLYVMNEDGQTLDSMFCHW